MLFAKLFLFSIGFNRVLALTQDYCNTELPSDAESTDSNTFMSNGLCMSQCQGYKYAIVQQKQCWCSDDDPENVVSVSNCDEICPGYKYENCGSGTTYYGWLRVANDYISGSSATSFSYSSIALSSSSVDYFSSTTEDSSSSSADYSSTSSVDSSSEATTSTEYIASSSSETSSSTSFSSSTTSSSSSTSSTSSSSSSSSTSSDSSSSNTHTSESSSSSTVSKTSSSVSVSSSSVVNQITITSIAITTITPTRITSDSNGSKITSAAAQSVESVYKTIVVSTTVVPSSTARAKNVNKSKGFWHSKGKVAGTFVAVGLVVLILLFLVIFFFVVRPRRESKKRDEFEKQYNEIIQTNLRDSVENDAKVSTGTLAVNNALKGFQEFDSDVSSNNEHKQGHEPEEVASFMPAYDMISDDQGSGYDLYTQDDELVPRRQSLGALKVVNMSSTTMDKTQQ
ncbi:unnamed protein product [Hanseniaspora opuntiae]